MLLCIVFVLFLCLFLGHHCSVFCVILYISVAFWAMNKNFLSYKKKKKGAL